MDTKKMVQAGSVFGKYPNRNIKKRIKEIIKKYEELIEKGEFGKVREELKNSSYDEKTLQLILQKLEKIEKKVYGDEDKFEKYTLKQCFEDFIELKSKEKVAPKTLQKYRRVYNTLLKFLDENVDLNSLNDKDFAAYYDYIVKSDFANKTKAYYINYAKSIFEYAYKSYKTKNRLMERFSYSEKKKEQSTYLPFSEQELKKLVEYHKKQNKKESKLFLQCMVLLLHTGMRVGELADLRVEDINLKKKELIIAARGGKTKNATRTIYIHPYIFGLLKELKNNSSDGFIIYLGDVINRADALSKRINRGIRKKIDEEGKVCHSFRKNFAQKLYQVSQAEYLIKYIMGHSQIDNLTFDTYNLGKINLEQVKKIIQKIKYPFLNF